MHFQRHVWAAEAGVLVEDARDFPWYEDACAARFGRAPDCVAVREAAPAARLVLMPRALVWPAPREARVLEEEEEQEGVDQRFAEVRARPRRTWLRSRRGSSGGHGHHQVGYGAP